MSSCFQAILSFITPLEFVERCVECVHEYTCAYTHIPYRHADTCTYSYKTQSCMQTKIHTPHTCTDTYHNATYTTHACTQNRHMHINICTIHTYTHATPHTNILYRDLHAHVQTYTYCPNTQYIEIHTSI